MRRKKRTVASYLPQDVIMAGVGVLLFIAGVSIPFPDPVKIGLIIAALFVIALSGLDFF
jgi:hypothetical protein